MILQPNVRLNQLLKYAFVSMGMLISGDQSICCRKRFVQFQNRNYFAKNSFREFALEFDRKVLEILFQIFA